MRCQLFGWVFCISIAALADDGKCFPEFSLHKVDAIGKNIGQTGLADLDRDGDLDWIAGNSTGTGGEIWWWEYQGPDTWIRHLMGKGKTDVGAAPFDVNGDGWIDVVSGGILLLNTGKPKQESFREYDIGTISSHDTEFADINGDGKMDLIANSDQAGLFWYEIPPDVTKKWTQHEIALISEHKIHGGVSPQAVGDIDGDGDADVVTAQAWYENADRLGLKWNPHKNIDFGRPERYGIAIKTWVGDLDGDGDNDVVQAEADHPDARVAWFENDGKGNWIRHMIKDEGFKQDFHSLIVADFDRDGDWDVFSGGGPLSAENLHMSFIWENLAGDKGKPTKNKWAEHIVAQKPCHEARGADVDGDGDIDICFKPWSVGNEHYYLRNMLVENKVAKR
jgi:hypothetical protein